MKFRDIPLRVRTATCTKLTAQYTVRFNTKDEFQTLSFLQPSFSAWMKYQHKWATKNKNTFHWILVAPLGSSWFIMISTWLGSMSSPTNPLNNHQGPFFSLLKCVFCLGPVHQQTPVLHPRFINKSFWSRRRSLIAPQPTRVFSGSFEGINLHGKTVWRFLMRCA